MFSEEALRNAAIELSLALANGTPEVERCDHGFSRHFTRRMNRLIRRTRHPALYRNLKSAACLLLALLLSGVVWLSVDAQAREIFFGWVFHWSEDDGVARYQFQRPEPEELPELSHARYSVPEAPEGYRLEGSYADDAGGRYIFMDDAFHIFELMYLCEPTTVWKQGFEIDARTSHPVTVKGQVGTFYPGTLEHPVSSLVWTDEAAGVLFCLSGLFDEKYLIQWAEGVSRIDPDRTESEAANAPPKCILPEAPDGYTLCNAFRDAGVIYYLFFNEVDTEFSLSYLYDKNWDYTLATVSGVCHPVSVNGHAGVFYPEEKEFANTLVWTDEKQGVLFTLSGHFDEDYMIQWAEGVVLDEP